jgi:superfamily II DNA or RNA helicase
MDYELIKAHHFNEVFLKIECENSTAMDLSEYFTFYVPNYKFHPSFKNKVWDGRIRLFNRINNTLYVGLLPHLKKFCEERNYELKIDDELSTTENFSLVEAKEFADTLGIPFEVRDYQIKAFSHCVRKNRALLLSPTASGKSLIIYLLVRWFSSKTLIIVPTVSLVSQLQKDFKDYGFESDKYVHEIMSGREKTTDVPIIISTWQSIYKMPKKWFDQFDVVIGDEAHLFKAKSLTSILTKLEDCKYRFGLTGTLDGSQTHRLVLEGLFGVVKQVTTTKELMDKSNLANLTIKALVLKHDEIICKANKNHKYQDEIDYIVRSNSRNKFIRNLTLSLEGNTLLLYQFVEKHGQVLYDMICAKCEDRPVFFIHGGVGVDEREEVRRITEEENGAIIVASYGTFSTGINIRRLHNIIFASPSKSKIRTLQSIGRGLRIGENKDSATLFDIADDLTYKSRKNFTLDHFMERMKIYNDEKFEYKIYTINLKEN